MTIKMISYTPDRFATPAGAESAVVAFLPHYDVFRTQVVLLDNPKELPGPRQLLQARPEINPDRILVSYVRPLMPDNSDVGNPKLIHVYLLPLEAKEIENIEATGGGLAVYNVGDTLTTNLIDFATFGIILQAISAHRNTAP